MSGSEIVDTALDRTVVLGYGKLGLTIRRRLPGWPADPPRMDGQVVLVTGAASGLGLAAAIGFARLGAGVRALARNPKRAQQAVTAVLRAAPGADVRPVACDLGSLADLIRFAGDFAAAERRLDVLVNNAGVMPAERRRSPDGHELIFATNVLAPFALTAGLVDLLTRSAPSRVINVSSGGMYAQSLPVGDWESDGDGYGPQKFYARSKRELMVLTELWAQRLKGTGVVIQAMHPGWADTEGVQTSMAAFRRVTRPILRTPEEGADTIVWLGAAPEPLRSTGRFWHDRRPRPTHYRIGASADSDEAAAELWRYCEAQLAAASSG